MACHKAFEATFYSYHIDDQVNRAGLYVASRAERATNKDIFDGIFGAAVIVQRRLITFKTHAVPFVHTTSVRVTADTGSVTFGWGF